jgi:hypothetical protein
MLIVFAFSEISSYGTNIVLSGRSDFSVTVVDFARRTYVSRGRMDMRCWSAEMSLASQVELESPIGSLV